MRINGKPVTPQAAKPGGFPRAKNPVAAREIARERAQEKARNALVTLSCGTPGTVHYADRETDLRYSSWAPKGKPHWCERCGTWRVKPRRVRRELPDEPLF